MPKYRFVLPNVKRLELSDSDWVEIKEQLTYREQQQLSGAMLRSVKTTAGDNEMGVDFGRYSVLRLQTWLVDWSFRDEEDKPVPLTPSAIDNLDPDTAQEINDALDGYLTERAEGKATPVSSKNGKS